MEDKKNTTQTIATRGLAIVGVVAALLIGIWIAVALFRIAPTMASSLASSFVSLTSVFMPLEQIVLTVPDEALSPSSSFILSWDHQEKEESGSYTFTYFCVDGIYFTYLDQAGEATLVYCNTPFQFINEDDSLTLVPHSDLDTTATVELTIAFTPNGESTPSLTASLPVIIEPKTGSLIVVDNSTEPGETNTTPTSSTIPSPTAPSPVPVSPQPGQTQTTSYPIGTSSVPSAVSTTGNVDLSIRTVGIGSVHTTTGEFTASTTVLTSQRAALKFVVENVGTRTSGPWHFIALLPTRPFHTFTSAQQVPLNPGDKVEFTLGFDQIEGQRFVKATITVDPTFQTYDSNRANNVLNQQFEVVTQ